MYSTNFSNYFLSMKEPLQSTWILGMHDAVRKDGVTYKTKGYQLHPKFGNSSYYDVYDMAIVTVDREIHFTRNIRPICLPHFPKSFTGHKATVAGW